MLLEEIQENPWFHYRFQITKLTTLLFLLVCFFLNLPFSEFFRHFLLSLTFSFSCLFILNWWFCFPIFKEKYKSKEGSFPSSQHQAYRHAFIRTLVIHLQLRSQQRSCLFAKAGPFSFAPFLLLAGLWGSLHWQLCPLSLFSDSTFLL